MTTLRLVPKFVPPVIPPQAGRANDWLILVMIVCLALLVGAFTTIVLDPGLTPP